MEEFVKIWDIQEIQAYLTFVQNIDIPVLFSSHSHSFTDADFPLDGGVSGAENFCRNPDNKQEGELPASNRSYDYSAASFCLTYMADYLTWARLEPGVRSWKGGPIVKLSSCPGLFRKSTGPIILKIRKG